MDLSSIVVTAIVSAVFSVLTSYIMLYIKEKKDKKANIDKQLSELLKLAITYPYIENKYFCDTWDPNNESQRYDEKYQRYDVFCNLLFNFFVDVVTFYNFKAEKIETYIDIKDWVQLHQKCWDHPMGGKDVNKNSYDKKFVEFIDGYKQN